MKWKTFLFCMDQSRAIALITAPAILLACVVGFGANVIQGREINETFRFIVFMFVWSFLLTYVLFSIAAIVVLRGRLKKAGVTLEYFASLPKEQRIQFQKAHSI